MPVYWGYQNVNSGVLKFYTMEREQFDTNSQSTLTDVDGTTSLYVGSSQMCVPNIMAALAQPQPEIPPATWVSTTVAIWTVGPDGNLPPPSAGRVTIPWWGGGTLPPLTTRASVFLGQNYQFGADTKCVTWMCQGDDPAVLGQVLKINDYNGQSISIDLPYANMLTGPQRLNCAAYMIYSGRQGCASQVYTFSASGAALQRPDDIRHPPNGNLKKVLYEYGDGSLGIPPDLLTYDDFDPGPKTMTWAIPDYNDPNGELRVKTDKIVVTGYGAAWHHTSTSPHYASLELAELSGDDFMEGYAYFTMNLSDWQDYCHNIDSHLFGRIWIQYVVNDEHYSVPMSTNINFCTPYRSHIPTSTSINTKEK